jgi:hypothetical protein
MTIVHVPDRPGESPPADGLDEAERMDRLTRR